MRNFTITFLFSVISFCCFAQTAFTEKTVLDMKKRFIENPTKSLAEDLSPSYILAGSEGQNFNYDQMKQFAANVKYLNWDMSELVVKQFGKIGIATGVTKHSVLGLRSNAKVDYHVRATYIYEYQEDRWRWISAQHTNIAPPPSEDKPEEIVKQWLTEYNKDDIAFFQDKASDDFLASNNGGKFFGKKAFEGRKSMPHNTEASDMKSIQSGNLAIVTGIMTYHHKQPDGTDLTDKNVFTFGMVKKAGKWMYATHHFSSRVEEKPEEVLTMFLTEYHKNPKAFFESRLSNDFRFLNGGKQTVPKEGVLSNSSTDPTDSEVTDVKAFQSGTLGIVSGIHVFKNRQSDGNIRADKVNFTYTLVKKNGKWFFAESHQTPVKE